MNFIRPCLICAAGTVSVLPGCVEPAPDAAPTATYRFEVPDFPGDRWYRGNTHAHTTESDGDSPPEVVARWYKDHDYNFLVLSDHNVRVDPDRFAHLQDSTFLLIAGEEVTSGFEDKPVHVNALDISDSSNPKRTPHWSVRFSEMWMPSVTRAALPTSTIPTSVGHSALRS